MLHNVEQVSSRQRGRPSPIWVRLLAVLAFVSALAVAVGVAVMIGTLGSVSDGWFLRSGISASAEDARYLQILSPGPTSVSRHNQLDGAKPYTVAIEDQAAEVRPGRLTVRGIAKGMKNVAVVCPATGKWYIAPPREDGSFSVELIIPDENGPLLIDVYSWDSPPNDPNYKTNISARLHLFVVGGRDHAPPPLLGHPAEGMRLVWEDDFSGPLSISSSRGRDATWFAGGKPSASGDEYADSLFVAADDARNPFSLKNGFLRIRATHDPALVDPNGWNRTWWSGHLSTGFPDESASITLREGYAEVRMMTPLGQGTWPAFWLLDSQSTLPSTSYGPVEIDVIEGYGHDNGSYAATAHYWPGLPPHVQPHQKTLKLVANPGLTNGFHTYGVKLTRSEMTWYLDGKEVHRAPLYRADTVSPFYLMVNLSMGGGWPILVPPSGYYDLWVDYVRVYR